MKLFSRTLGRRSTDIRRRKQDVATIKLMIARLVNCIFNMASDGAAEDHPSCGIWGDVGYF